jgi:hypothetical protein
MASNERLVITGASGKLGKLVIQERDEIVLRSESVLVEISLPHRLA